MANSDSLDDELEFTPEFGVKCQAYTEKLYERANERLTERLKGLNRTGVSLEEVNFYGADMIAVKYYYNQGWAGDEFFEIDEFFTEAEMRKGKLKKFMNE